MSWAARISIVLAAPIAFGAAASAQQSAATMFRGDAAHHGLYESPAPALKSVRWRFRTPGKIFSSPSVDAGVVFIGSSDNSEYAVRASDGTQVWKFVTKGPVRSSAAISDGTVFFSSADGNVYAVDEIAGTQRWRFQTGGERRFSAPGIHGMQPRTEIMPDPYDLLLSSPAVWNGTVYVGSGDHNVYALDARSGAIRWKFTTGNVVHASPAVDGGAVFIGSWDRYFYALNARTGALLWKFATGDDRDIYNQVGIAGSAAVSNGVVYFGCRDSHFYALDAGTGALVWKRDHHGSWVIASPAIAAGTVYYTTSDEQKFYAVDATTGILRFRVGYGTFAYSSPSIAGNVAYFGAFDGRLYGVAIDSGKVVAQFSTDASSHLMQAHLNASGNLDLATFYSSDSTAAYPTLDGTVVALNELYALGSIVGSPAIAGGTLFIGTTEGTLYALD
ncbi:MAG TPA: PQQ-binding-like beta-propeller repeat protein [Candidatus Cybelea sp.]|jgi:outer membrane protein assembly factor BamB|nr:PQQ-binding-like beta-propeller repeat protein [Candidatus Cybelea sp.]